MRFAILMTWATFGLSGAADSSEPPNLLLPAPRALAQAPKEPAQAPEPPNLLIPEPRPMAQVPKEPAKTPAPPEPGKTEKEPAKTEKEPAKSPKELPKTEKEASKKEKEAPKTEEAAPTRTHVIEPLLPAYPAFMDPRAYVWTQHRLPPPDQPCVEMACQLRLCLGDHRCPRNRIADYLLRWPCPSLLLFGKCCPDNTKTD